MNISKLLEDWGIVLNKKKEKSISLKRKIIWTYFIITFITAVIESVIDSVFDDVIQLRFFPLQEEIMQGLIGSVYIGISLLAYVIAGIVFYFVTRKAIKEDNDRRIEEQNLLYATVAHDLKTPIISVQGFSKALSEHRILESETEEIYNIIYNKSKQMNELVEILAEYSKHGTREYEMQLEKIDVCSFVRDIVADCYLDLENHKVELTIDIPEETYHIMGDKKELRRAITKIIIEKHGGDILLERDADGYTKAFVVKMNCIYGG